METTVRGRDLTLRDWAPVGSSPAGRSAGWNEWRALLASGVPAQDIVTYWAVLAPGEPVSALSGRALRWDLRNLSKLWPDLSLRAATGWAMVNAAFFPYQHASRICEHVAPWADAGLGESGWVFAAAGLTLAEAQAVAGDEDAWSAVQVLAGLSGFSLLP